MLDNYPDVLSFRQVMEITHVGRNLLLRLLNSGEIPAFKMGKLWKVYKQDLIQYMLDSSQQSVTVPTVKKLCDGLGITLVDFFNASIFTAIDQEIR